ncbi:MAG TPA: hypothetical protein VNT22_11080 [Baekduia sp.]|nr:hypothetical protein [Baekduia sp.]
MSTVAQLLAIVVTVTSLGAGFVGAWYWRAGRAERLPWRLIRIAQVVAGVQLVGALVLLVAGLRPQDDLYWLYASLPVGVGYFAEQIKISVAQGVLDARDLADGAAVAALPGPEQSVVVAAILRRELGVMMVAAFVSAFLALRAFGTV